MDLNPWEPSTAVRRTWVRDNCLQPHREDEDSKDYLVSGILYHDVCTYAITRKIVIVLPSLYNKWRQQGHRKVYQPSTEAWTFACDHPSHRNS